MARAADNSRLGQPGKGHFLILLGALALCCLAPLRGQAGESLPADLVAVQLDLTETNEALQIEPGEHQLASGKRIFKLESGQICSRALWQQAGASTSNGGSLEMLLSSLDQPPRSTSHRDDSLDIEGFPDALKDLRIDRDVQYDPRYACLSKKLAALPEADRSRMIEVVLEAAAANLKTQFAVALDAARRIEPLVRSESTAPAAYWLDGIDTRIAKCSAYASHPAAAFAFCTALRLAGDLHCTSLHEQIRKYAERANTERVTLADLSSNQRLTERVARYGLAGEGMFTKALTETAP